MFDASQPAFDTAVPAFVPDYAPSASAAGNDNFVAAAPTVHAFGERTTFELPQRIWTAMLACYALFFAAIGAATGTGSSAVFAIVISALYTVIYFGAGRIVARQAGPQPASPLDGPSRRLETLFGPMDEKAVAAQVLIVPASLALFAVGILAVRIAVMG